MKRLFLKVVRYRGSYVVLGRNQAVKMLLSRVEQPQGWPMHSHPAFRKKRGILRGIETLK